MIILCVLLWIALGAAGLGLMIRNVATDNGGRLTLSLSEACMGIIMAMLLGPCFLASVVIPRVISMIDWDRPVFTYERKEKK